MKRILLILVIGLGCCSCSKDSKETTHESNLIGKWKLVEQLSDPGDGSGVYMPIKSNKTLEFFADGRVSSNSTLCYMSSASDGTGTGIYDSAESTIILSSCGVVLQKIHFEIINSRLILNYPCIEACGQKFTKLNY